MRNVAYTSLVAALLLLGTAAPAWAQATKYAQAGMGFLKIDPAADVAALGGTHIGTAGRATAMFSNPAALANRSAGSRANATSTAALTCAGTVGRFRSIRPGSRPQAGGRRRINGTRMSSS